MFNFDRGLDVAAVNTEVEVVVDFLCEGLSDLSLVPKPKRGSDPRRRSWFDRPDDGSHRTGYRL